MKLTRQRRRFEKLFNQQRLKDHLIKIIDKFAPEKTKKKFPWENKSHVKLDKTVFLN